MDRNEQGESDNCFHDHREESEILGSLREAPGETRIEKFRAIVAAGSLMEVEGQPVDLFSANFVVQVHDALKPENGVKLMQGTVLRTIDVAFKTVERARQRAASGATSEDRAALNARGAVGGPDRPVLEDEDGNRKA